MPRVLKLTPIPAILRMALWHWAGVKWPEADNTVSAASRL
jgi:hypothetical protein